MARSASSKCLSATQRWIRSQTEGTAPARRVLTAVGLRFGGAAAGNATVDPGERILRVNAGADGPQVTIRSNDALNQITNSVTFTSRGLPKATNGAAQSGIFRICDDRGLKVNADGASTVARGVVLSLSGKVRTTKNVVKIASCP